MWGVMEQRPRVERGRTENGKAKTWAAVVSGERLPFSESQQPVRVMTAMLFATTTHPPDPKLEKVLMVADAEGTAVYVTFKEVTPCHLVKRLFERSFSMWGNHIKMSILATTHMFSYRDDHRIRSWKVAKTLSEETRAATSAATSGSSIDTLAMRAGSDTSATQMEITDLNGKVALLGAVPERLRREWSELENKRTQLIVAREVANAGGNEADARRVETERYPPHLRFEAVDSWESKHDAEVELESTARTLCNNMRPDAKEAEDIAKLLTYRIIDFMPNAPLILQDFMSEAEREGLIRDNIKDAERLQAAFTKAREEEDNPRADSIQKTIVEKAVAAGLQLVDDGCLPGFDEKHPAYRASFIDRTMRVTSAISGERFTNGTQVRRLMSKADICSSCSASLRKEPRVYLDTTRGAWKPTCMMQAEKTPKESLLMFCTTKCARTWNATLMCRQLAEERSTVCRRTLIPPPSSVTPQRCSPEHDEQSIRTECADQCGIVHPSSRHLDPSRPLGASDARVEPTFFS